MITTKIGGELWSSGRLSTISLIWSQRSIVIIHMTITLLLSTSSLYTSIPIAGLSRYAYT